MKNNNKIYVAIIIIVIGIIAVLTLTRQDNNTSEPGPIVSENIEPSENDQSEKTEDINIADYFLLKENTVYKYVSVNENSPIDNFYNQERYLMHQEGNISQVKIIVPGAPTEFVEVMELTDDYAKLLYGDSKYNHINFINNLPAEDNFLVMKKPLEIGSNWSVNDTSVSEITNLNIEVEVPFGKFNAIEVATNHVNGGYTKNYYVKNLGLIKTIVSSVDTGEHISVLDSVTANASVTSSYATVYNYNVISDEVTVEREQLIFGTNPNYELMLENILKSVPDENYIPLLTPNTTINSVTVTYDDITVTENTSTLTLDLSKEFLEELNAGASIEQTVLDCLVDTVGLYYGVNSVTILIDGEAVETGHFDFGEPMIVG